MVNKPPYNKLKHGGANSPKKPSLIEKADNVTQSVKAGISSVGAKALTTFTGIPGPVAAKVGDIAAKTFAPVAFAESTIEAAKTISGKKNKKQPKQKPNPSQGGPGGR